MERYGIPLFNRRLTPFQKMRAYFSRLLSRLGRPRTRLAKGAPKRRSVISERAGRNIRIVLFKKGENSLAPLATVINALHNGKYDWAEKRIHIAESDFVGWERLVRESLTLVLVVDLSRSTFPFLNLFAEIINSLTGFFRLHQDRIGLISLQGSQAQIMNHPTHNYRVVTKNLLQLRIHGETPLADGLFKALAMVQLEKYRKPGTRNLVILISDCYPEPITGDHPDLMEEPAYREAIRAAAVYRQTQVSLLVINPALKKATDKEIYPGERLADALVRESRGRIIRLYRTEPAPSRTAYDPPSRAELHQILTGIEDVLRDRSRTELNKPYY
jgi:Mg-chelatase subunit ChlD